MVLETTAVERYRREAEECRQRAERALRPADKDAWLRLAADWARLAEGTELCRDLKQCCEQQRCNPTGAARNAAAGPNKRRP